MNEKNKDKKRYERIIRQMKEGKLETLASIVANEEDVIIRIGDKLIVMEGGFLQRFKEHISFGSDFPEARLVIARIMEIQAKRIKALAKEDINQAKK